MKKALDFKDHNFELIKENDSNLYKSRFENLFRVAKKITSSLNMSEILEAIRDEARLIIPDVEEVCLLLVDPDAANYARPLHCARFGNSQPCHLCKKGKYTLEKAIANPTKFICFRPNETEPFFSETAVGGVREVALPVYQNGVPLAILDVIARTDCLLPEHHVVMLSDLVELAANVLVNAKRHWTINKEKLTLDRILSQLRPFVPHTVQSIVTKNPEDPQFDKHDEEVTVLFLDVGEYTRISESLTQDQVNFVIETYFSAFLDIIHQNSGDINETAGDGLMVIFLGTPEHSASNALKTAVAIRSKTAELNEELKGLFQPICVNMGINSGKASVGMSKFRGNTGTRMTYTATGHVTNIAARMAERAQAGNILVGEKTALLMLNQFPLESRGFMQFKNISSEVHVYAVSTHSHDFSYCGS